MQHSQNEWREIVENFKQSGLSQRKWCSIHDVNRNRLQYWISRFRYLELGTEVEFAELVTGGDHNGSDTSK